MESLYILIPVSVVLVFVIAFLFWWSTQSGQFDDLKGPAYQILMDDDRSNPHQSNEIQNTTLIQESVQEEGSETVSAKNLDNPK